MTHPKGLSLQKVKELQELYGKNEISTASKGMFLKKVLHIFSEPIYSLLACSSVIYFILGERSDGIIMIAFVIFVIGIDMIQDLRTGNTLRKLKEISSPKIRVIREGNEYLIAASELVPGDYMLLTEGIKIPSDGYLIEASGLCVDESILTGEADGVYKFTKEQLEIIEEKSEDECDYDEYAEDRRAYCYAGTFVILGNGIAVVDKIGNDTEYGKIAHQLSKISSGPSLLQRQMRLLAKQCTVFAAVLFILVSLFTFINLENQIISERIVSSLLAGIVLALSMVPGEFPVILSVFLSMGALRLARKKILIRHLPAVEALGAISVLCLDKTGTITQNKLEVTDSYMLGNVTQASKDIIRQEEKFCKIIRMASKCDTYDPVEKAILTYCDTLCKNCTHSHGKLAICSLSSRRNTLIKEYPYTNELKAMGQVWKENEMYVIAAKGSPETILSLCYLSSDQQLTVMKRINEFLEKGLRVIAFADRTITAADAIPAGLMECRLFFRGIIGLSDPIREKMQDNIQAYHEAGIRVVMITGDHPLTAKTIASNIGIENSHKVITGAEINKMSEEELRERVQEYNLFARVLPLHKMRIVKALKDQGEIVAMTGDGVNDSAAQKIADIGIAMGKHGSEVCREAAEMILLDDKFDNTLDALKDGRRIYQNIIKTIGYVFAIHIPIALISLAGPLLGIDAKSLMLLPIHIVLLELVMDPTCSIALERQPAEERLMKMPPRRSTDQILSRMRLIKSIVQGTMIFMASFGLFYGMLLLDYPPELARTVGFTVLVISSCTLIIVNCSDTDSIIKILRKIRRDMGIGLVNLFTVLGLCIMIYSPFNTILGFAPLGPKLLLVTLGAAIGSVCWYELVKFIKRVSIKRRVD